MKRALLAAALALCVSPVWADPVVEYGCIVLAQKPGGGVDKILPDTKVLEPTRSQPRFSIALPPQYDEAAVQCIRSDLVPAENDWKVLRAGYPFYVTQKATGRTIVIDLRDGQFTVEFKQADMPAKEELDRLQARINQLQTSMDSAEPAKK